MHDPDVVVFDIHLPIPRRTKFWDRHADKRWTLGRQRRTNAENLGQPVWPWYRPRGYRPALAGRTFGLVELCTVWHTEPQGRDSGTVCKGMGGSDLTWHNIKWAVRHRHHLHFQFRFVQRVRSWLFLRCADCNKRFFWKEAHFGYMGGDATYHERCMTARHLRGQLDDAAKALTFTANDTERWRVERWLEWREEKAAEALATDSTGSEQP
jgi:hypothetical protein